MATHAASCRVVGISFIPLAVESLGGWSDVAAKTISRIGHLLGQRLGIPPPSPLASCSRGAPCRCGEGMLPCGCTVSLQSPPSLTVLSDFLIIFVFVVCCLFFLFFCLCFFVLFFLVNVFVYIYTLLPFCFFLSHSLVGLGDSHSTMIFQAPCFPTLHPPFNPGLHFSRLNQVAIAHSASQSVKGRAAIVSIFKKIIV